MHGHLDGGQDVPAVALHLGRAQDGGLFEIGRMRGPGVRQSQQRLMAEHLEQGPVFFAGDVSAEGQQFLEDGEPPGVQTPRPLAVQKQRRPVRDRRAHFAQDPALLGDPGETALLLQLLLQPLRQGCQVADVGDGVVEHFFRQRPPGPVLALEFFVEGDGEQVLEHRLEPGFLETEEAAGELGVEEVVDANVEIPIERAHVVVGAVEYFFDRRIAKDRSQR